MNKVIGDFYCIHNIAHLQIFGTNLSNMAQDSLQDEIHLHGAGFLLGFLELVSTQHT